MSDWVTKRPELSEEDLKRVQSVISSGYNDFERKPLRPGILALVCLAILTFFSVFSWGLAHYYGVV